MFCISIKHKKNPKSTFWRRSPSDLRDLGARGRPNPRWAAFPQNSNSKFGRGSAQILNLNFAAPAGPARTGQLFRAPAAKNSPPGAAKTLWPGCGKVVARATLSLKVARFLNYVLFYIWSYFLINKRIRFFGPDRLFHELLPPEGDYVTKLIMYYSK